ncbi:MAG: hypothetical protein WDO56_18335 [Gammaproteobacteria bacterium]
MNQFAGRPFSRDYDSDMSKISANGPVASDEGPNGTIELELSTAEVRALTCPETTPPDSSRAPDLAEQATSEALCVPRIEATNTAACAPARAHRRLAPVAGAFGIAIATASLGGVAYIAANHPQTMPVLAKEAPPIATAATPIEPQAQSAPVTFRNPFDASEVFEFPPGTPQPEARRKVAELLSQRAQERQNLFVRVRHRTDR